MEEPAFLMKSMDEQLEFRDLFVIPFTKKFIKSGSQRWAVVIDGLDGCSDVEGQCRIENHP